MTREVKKEKKLKIVEIGAGKEIASIFGCTPETVSNALRLKTHSLQSIRIRKYARERYTVLEY